MTLVFTGIINGHYNQPPDAYRNSTNAITVPAALLSDALTMISGNWNAAAQTTANAALSPG